MNSQPTDFKAIRSTCWVLAALVILWMLVGHQAATHADGVNREDVTPDAMPATLTAERMVREFYDETWKVNRGVANTPFAGSCGAWIVIQLSNEAEWQNAVGLSKKQAGEVRALAKSIGREANQPPGDNDLGLALTDGPELYRSLLAIADGKEQERKMLQLILRIEGLAALRHPCFCKKLDIQPDQRRAIVAIARSFVSESAAAFHQSIFTGSDHFQHDELADFLRVSARALDRRIATALNEEQLRVLAKLLEGSKELPPCINGPGPGP